MNRPGAGIAFILCAMFCISINDMLIKFLSGDYPLHQMVFVRSAIGIVFSFFMLHYEGGVRTLNTPYLGWHLTRGLLIVVANMSFFAALATMPLGDVTAMFFVAPLFITLLSIPFLGEQVGPRRIAAVVCGLIGVIIMLRPGTGDFGGSAGLTVSLLPVAAALCYAAMQILTRKLGAHTRAAAMAIYVQFVFIVVSAGFWVVAGDGRFADGLTNPSAVFLLRAWVWPAAGDWWVFGVLGLMSALIGYTLAQAYRLAAAATIAPFEYAAMPFAIFWGWVMFDDFPDVWVFAGIALIAGSGIYVFYREQSRAADAAA